MCILISNKKVMNLFDGELIVSIKMTPDEMRTDNVFSEQGEFIRTERYAKFNGNWFQVNNNNTIGQVVEFV